MRLDKFMALKGWNDSQMAELVGKTRSVIVKYRSGKTTPPLEVIDEIRRVTEGAVTFEDFLPSAWVND